MGSWRRSGPEQPADWLVSIYFPPKSFDLSLILLSNAGKLP